MIIAQTPFRISFFGGGTDYPSWYLKHGGSVLSVTIDKYCYVTCRYLPPFFDCKHRVVWSKIETVAEVGDIQHPLVRGALSELGFDESRGVEVHYQGDLPARTGMGSSSSFAVGLLKSLHALQGRMTERHDLALEAIRLEQEVLQETVGSQDQMAAAYGGLNRIEFRKDGTIQAEPLILPRERIEDLESHLLLFYTGTSRLASEIAKTVVANLSKHQDDLHRMHAMVNEAIDILRGDGPLSAFGRLLHEGWCLKRELSPQVSNPIIDGIYDKARAAGALGGKLLGAGESGFMLFFVPPEKRADVKWALIDLLNVPFRFSWNGSSIIHYDPEYASLGVTRP
ncbi:MAG: kinase [Alphaproteobacteria bacterium]|nr:kinase [Alphaproteobacteria bacterium]